VIGRCGAVAFRIGGRARRGDLGRVVGLLTAMPFVVRAALVAAELVVAVGFVIAVVRLALVLIVVLAGVFIWLGVVRVPGLVVGSRLGARRQGGEQQDREKREKDGQARFHWSTPSMWGRDKMGARSSPTARPAITQGQQALSIKVMRACARMGGLSEKE